MSDYLVKLYDLPEGPDENALAENGIKIKRAMSGDRTAILSFVRDTFSDHPYWQDECGYALFQNPATCFIAVKDKKILGFACYDTTARGYFGPTGVDPVCRGKGVGAALLLHTLRAMRHTGYAYAIIGWCENAHGFYEKCAGAIEIPDTPPEKCAYSNLIAVD